MDKQASVSITYSLLSVPETNCTQDIVLLRRDTREAVFAYCPKYGLFFSPNAECGEYERSAILQNSLFTISPQNKRIISLANKLIKVAESKTDTHPIEITSLVSQILDRYASRN